MSEVDDLLAKVAECRRLGENSTDPLSRAVYQAMSAEFIQKLSAVSRGQFQVAEGLQSVPNRF